MIEVTAETEALVRAEATATGRTPDEVVRTALARAGTVLPWRNQARPRPAAATREQLIAAMEEIAARSAARPIVDPRAPDEIIGYDDFGMPR